MILWICSIIIRIYIYIVHVQKRMTHNSTFLAVAWPQATCAERIGVALFAGYSAHNSHYRLVSGQAFQFTVRKWWDQFICIQTKNVMTGLQMYNTGLCVHHDQDDYTPHIWMHVYIIQNTQMRVHTHTHMPACTHTSIQAHLIRNSPHTNELLRAHGL